MLVGLAPAPARAAFRRGLPLRRVHGATRTDHTDARAHARARTKHTERAQVLSCSASTPTLLHAATKNTICQLNSDCSVQG